MYESLLDRVYELEGLLHLALERDEIPERLDQLIADKALRIAEPFADRIAPAPAPAAPSPVEEEEAHPYESPYKEPQEEEPEEEPEVEAEEFEEYSEAPMAEDEPVAEVERQPLRRHFSLNDRFRFSRELFGGSPARFDEILHVLDGMDSAAEAEAYLCDELGWEPDDDDMAAEFVEIVRAGFADTSHPAKN
ncbi:MAG: hypothetical protein K2O24_05350 [Muribaculaceae bacterium]|nr:hypothetical protein [Muribaculaceae bacterium]